MLFVNVLWWRESKLERDDKAGVRNSELGKAAIGLLIQILHPKRQNLKTYYVMLAYSLSYAADLSEYGGQKGPHRWTQPDSYTATWYSEWLRPPRDESHLAGKLRRRKHLQMVSYPRGFRTNCFKDYFIRDFLPTRGIDFGKERQRRMTARIAPFTLRDTSQLI
ncbi:hypothetical protein MG293_011241 [Ovis ammon polii]|uniref:Uncharacterized protein n=1 Tax=Ovis ammon polii TaxID=230172 RepID=A0AAD4Y8S1_OVIAM|nr:hypothetical protein MG293_011241 [Ovis ammon polii]